MYKIIIHIASNVVFIYVVIFSKQRRIIHFRIYYNIPKELPRLLRLPRITYQKTEAISFHVSYQ